MLRRTAVMLAVMSMVSGGISRPADALGGPIGSAGLGDRLFPLAGNGGYDVTDYRIVGSWNPKPAQLRATAVILAVATQDLRQFDLDLRGFTVDSVEVNHREARFTRSGQELTIRPTSVLPAGRSFEVEVHYRGTPEPVIDPDGSSEGWMQSNDGVVALGEPQGSPSWFPSNDHPTDKATFSLELTVPKDLVVVSNGQPDRPQRRGALTTYTWRELKPMATYLATVSIGHFSMSESTTSGGLPVISAVARGLEADSAPSLARIPEMVDWLTTIFGPYPFDSTGAIVVDAPDVGYHLETQDRPTFTRAPNDRVMIHELAHQWIGNSVSVASWQEMWLNEGFAGYVEWLWSEHDGGPTSRQLADELYQGIPADDPFWSISIGPSTLPGATLLFSEPVYLRGAMTLQALRDLLGDPAFFQIMHRWATDHQYGNVTTEQFIALAETVSGRSLDDFFRVWLDTPAKP